MEAKFDLASSESDRGSLNRFLGKLDGAAQKFFTAICLERVEKLLAGA